MISERLMGEGSLRRDFEALSLSQRLVRSVSQKLKKKNHIDEGEEEDDVGGVSLRCLTLYVRGGGCKVGADTSDEFGDPGSRRRSSASEEGKGFASICGTDEATVDCFSYGVKEKLWRRNNRKALELEESPKNSRMHVFLPDDILEMCLMRLPLTSLMNARLVCRKWRYLTTTPRFMQMRREGLYQSPWLFVFGVVKDGYCSGEIHALDVSLNQWHRLDAEVLKGRFLFSVASIWDDIYIVGGCSSLTNYGKVDRSSFKTHKGVLVFSPLTRSWHKVASMKHARSTPVLGICEISSDCVITRNQQNRQERRFPRSRIGVVSDIYEDPHRLSVRRQLRNSLDENDVSLFSNVKPHKVVKQRSDHSNAKDCKRFVMIAVGGLGSWDEPLDSGEIYDSVSNKWTEIQRLPVDFGAVCSGVVCDGMFYVYSENDKLAGYDIERGYWVGIQTFPSPPRVLEYYPKLIACNSRLFMLSVSWCEGDGEIGRRNKAVRKLWELDLMHLNWTEVSTHPDAPMDWNAAFVADQNFIFGVEMFKIFGQVLDFLTMCDVSDAEVRWRHISRNHVAHELDASSCMTKSMAVLHL
ncbi:F-box/kelch-repeat protein At5g42350-like [Actinidia eriantha]|uniref:F-box/kelch-repeat protein At5g42350-like n=1 Tax=Actinidia eriantha TaxID=165200 RepID=UPI0025894950|nr:F-box/kelch-repeat protein At5g42350-like [Actinidia eriantha]XP_057470022.1 F-box/kelch-repeat protein At5g42350-like [Actinidia eriantha]XP_057470023.1 F-box/kelch-repeat protein At5g42350-like [Actinidia eriantha]